MNLVAVDIETTGVFPNLDHRLIQIGMVLPNGHKIRIDVYPEGPICYDPEAMKINGFTVDRIMKGIEQREADDIITGLLSEFGYEFGSLTAVGYNVGGFDLKFISKELPLTARFFSHRTLDLTSLGIFHELITGKSYREQKEEFHEEIAKRLGRNERHDALYDAQAALEALEMFKDNLKANI